MKRKAEEKLQKIIKSVTSYLKSDSYMYSCLLSHKFSHFFSTATVTVLRGRMRTERAKTKAKFVHKIIDYLKSDCYMYAPLVACSASLQETTAAAPLHIPRRFKQLGKRRYGKKSSPTSTLVRSTLAFQKCLINPVGRSSSPSGGSSRGLKIRKNSTPWTGEELVKIIKDGV
ncbi:hypothetical protein AG4045_016546 [Apium graveolens]|uniref:Uncharacterized protein n=2 Tax=Apium graveolens TaxID=4045 RepID=A0A6L5B8W0_APIGR|nr:hypothetical protein AG4045_016546 [Apium graveolens]